MHRVTVFALATLVLFGAACKKSQPTPSNTAGPTPAPGVTDPGTPPATNENQAPATTTGGPATPGVAGEPIPELPEYPGAVRTGSKIDSSPGFSKAIEMEYMTTDPFPKVVEFYKKAITDNGWTILTQDLVKPGEAEWRLSKGTSVAEIEVDQKRGGGVEIKLERKDR